MWLWRLRSPTVYHLQAEEQGRLKYNSVWVRGLRNVSSGTIHSREGELRTRNSDIWEQDKIDVPTQEEGERELVLSLPTIWVPNALVDTHPHWWRWSSYLLRQMLIFSKNTLMDHPEIFYQLSVYPLPQLGWHIKLIIIISDRLEVLLQIKKIKQTIP